MKKIALFAVAALALASCSNDETTAVNEGQAISFRAFVNKATHTSTVANLTTANINSFVVTAMVAGEGAESSYFENALFTKDGSTFTSATPYYWPLGESLNFYAYSIAGAAGQVAVTDYKTFEVTPAAGENPANQADLVYAATKGKNKENDAANGVGLNFRHTGAKIAAKVKNTSDKLKFEVEGWKLGYLSASGKFTFTDANTDGNNQGLLTPAQWSDLVPAAAETQYASTFDKKYIAVNTNDAVALDGEFILVPQALTKATEYVKTGDTYQIGDKVNGSFIGVKLNIKTVASNGNDYIVAAMADGSTVWAIWPIDTTWEPGKKYTYTVDLAGGGYYEDNEDNDDPDDPTLDPLLKDAVIKFVSVTVDEWVDGGEYFPTME